MASGRTCVQKCVQLRLTPVRPRSAPPPTPARASTTRPPKLCTPGHHACVLDPVFLQSAAPEPEAPLVSSPILDPSSHPTRSFLDPRVPRLKYPRTDSSTPNPPSASSGIPGSQSRALDTRFLPHEPPTHAPQDPRSWTGARASSPPAVDPHASPWIPRVPDLYHAPVHPRSAPQDRLLNLVLADPPPGADPQQWGARGAGVHPTTLSAHLRARGYSNPRYHSPPPPSVRPTRDAARSTARSAPAPAFRAAAANAAAAARAAPHVSAPPPPAARGNAPPRPA